MKNFQFYLLLFVLVLFGSCGSDTKTVSANELKDKPPISERNEPVKSEPAPVLPQPAAIPQGSGLSVAGKIANAPVGPITALKIVYGSPKPETIAQGEMDADGSFSLSMNPQEKGVYSIKAGGLQLLFLLKGNEKELSIDTDAKNFKAYNFNIKGAPINNNYFRLMKGAMLKSFNVTQMKQEIMKEKDPLVASLVALQVLNDPGFLPIHKKIFARLSKDKTIDKKKYVETYGKILAAMSKKQEAMAKKQAGRIQVGMEAPELAYQDPKGKIRKLSDLRGKLVLLDFWASWCAPCRKANPKVVAIYNKYKDQGFTVFSVSLDGSQRDFSAKAQEVGRAKWIRAIEKDGLVWENHVSDLRSWASEASAKYDVSAIPATFLIGRDGKIVAVSPGARGKDLEAIVKKHL